MSARPTTPIEPSADGERARLAQRLARHLQRVGHPRAQMALMVSATGSAGFFVDWLLLKAGFTRMSLRYALAVGLAYGVFLLLVKLWLVFHFRRKARAASPPDGATASGGSSGSSWNLGSFSGSGGSGGSGGGASSFRGGGGSSGGGGASDSFDEVDAAPARAVAVPISSGGGSGGSGGSGPSLDLDGDEALAIIAVVVAVAGAFVAAGYLVVQAPTIFGEVLLDGTLSAGLYKRLRTLEHHDWLETALEKTVLPFLAVAVLAGTAGHFLQKAAPEARSIGGVFHHIVG